MAQGRLHRGLTAHGHEIRDDEPGRALGHGLEVHALGERDGGQQAAQQLGADAQVGQGEAQLAVDEIGRAQARVDGFGRRRRGHQRQAGGADGVAQRVQHQRRERGRGGGGQ